MNILPEDIPPTDDEDMKAWLSKIIFELNASIIDQNEENAKLQKQIDELKNP